MKAVAVPASNLSTGQMAALAVDSSESTAAALPSEALLILRGLTIALVLISIAALAGAAIASLTFGYPIGGLA